MKTDLITSITATVLGAAVAFFICNMFLPSIEDVSVKTLNAVVEEEDAEDAEDTEGSENDNDYTLTEPDVNVFNFRALNPTVEVYVGDCTEFDEDGQCLEDDPVDVVEDEIDNIEEETEEEEAKEDENTEGSEDNQNGPTN